MEFVANKIRDKIRVFEREDRITNTNFLTPAEVEEALTVLRGYEYCLMGGFEEAERRILVIGSKNADISNYCKVLRINTTSGKKLMHREVLGSILGLGIKREMLGDILVSEIACDVVIMKEMETYILNNLTNVGREKVKICEVPFEEICVQENHKIVTFHVASLRVDAVISVVFGIGRNESVKLVSAEKVLINFLPCKSVSKQIKLNDLVSVRGFGRFKLMELVGTTSKGRLKINVEM